MKWNCPLFILIILLFFSLKLGLSICTDGGHRFDIGDTWVDAKACDACECFSTGHQCYARLDDGQCKLNSSMVSPFDRVCRYNMKLYTTGHSFVAVDGCNTCTCTSSGMNCTINSCYSSGFAKPRKVPLYGECLYDGDWFPLHAQWLTRDGCNTCYCYTVGNYRGGHVCTKNRCQTQISGIAG